MVVTLSCGFSRLSSNLYLFLLVQCWLFYSRDFFSKVPSLFFVTDSWTKNVEKWAKQILGAACNQFSCLIIFLVVSPQAVLEARSVKVLVVAFGSVEGAQMWFEQTGCNYNMVLDPQRTVRTRVFTLTHWLTDWLTDWLTEWNTVDLNNSWGNEGDKKMSKAIDGK